MPTSAQIQQKIADLIAKRADIERKIGEAQRRRAAKESEAAAREASAARTSSRSSQQSYQRQADSARKAALEQSSKIAGLSRALAEVSRDEGRRQKELQAAQKAEMTIRTRAEDRARLEREREAKRLSSERKADERRQQEQRLVDERRHREEQARIDRARREDRVSTALLVDSTEKRLTAQIDAIRSPVREKLRILYATASPRGDLRLDEEIRRVTATVRASTNRDQVKIEHLPAVTPGDLLDGLTSFRPHVVHFSGHADEASLIFDDGSDIRGRGREIAARAFKSAIDAPDEPPMLVVLNACRSVAQLEFLLGRVPFAVGMSDNIGDVDALTFATRFYRTLAEGQSISAAMATARADMEMNGLPDHDLPTLAALEGADPTTVRLVIAE